MCAMMAPKMIRKQITVLPDEPVVLTMPFAEVQMHLRKARQNVLVALRYGVSGYYAEMLNPDGTPFTIPVSYSEVGIFRNPDNSFYGYLDVVDLVDAVNRAGGWLTVCHATQRDQDVIPALLAALDAYAPQAAQAIRDDHSDALALLKVTHRRLTVREQALVDEVREWLLYRCDLLASEHNLTFGVHEGDASDYGFSYAHPDEDEEGGV